MNAREDLQDFLSVADIALIEAVDSYDESKGSLPSWVVKLVRWSLFAHLRAHSEYDDTTSVEDLGTQNGNKFDIPDPNADSTFLAVKWSLNEMLAILSERHRRVVLLRCKEVPFDAIARGLKVSRQQACRIYAESLQKLRAKFAAGADADSRHGCALSTEAERLPSRGAAGPSFGAPRLSNPSRTSGL
jgi:RNA polymerase sigma factor (sigma-70 family)